MSILALDLGTRTGWATRTPDGRIVSGTWLLARPSELRKLSLAETNRDYDPRFAALWTRLMVDIGANYKVRHAYFEDVQFMSSQLQGQLWGGFRAIIMLWGKMVGAHTAGIPVGTLKKFATRHGGATKGMMAASLRSLGLFRAEMDDNEIDAIHLLLCAEADRLTYPPV